MEKINTLFISDIVLGDNKSSYTMMSEFFKEYNDEICVITPGALDGEYHFDYMTVPTYFYKHNNHALRLISEIYYGFAICIKLLLNFRKFRSVSSVVCYSPSIFIIIPIVFMQLVLFQKKKYYLILRDIFPDWAIDRKIIKNGCIKYIFRLFAGIQFKVFDYVGVQTKSDIDYLRNEYLVSCELFYLPNWYPIPSFEATGLNLTEETQDFLSRHKKYLVYAGNLGRAQDMQFVVDAFKKLLTICPEYPYSLLILGKGEMYDEIKESAKENPNRILVTATVDSATCNQVIANSSGGIVSLDNSLTTNNIPGKFLNYLSLGVPTLGFLNESNLELHEVISHEKLGKSCVKANQNAAIKLFQEFADYSLNFDKYYLINYFAENFSYSICSAPLSQKLRKDKFR